MRTNLGKYLYSCRMLRGGSNIGEYISEYDLGGVISESYYRDLEAGRRVVKLDTADKLADQLDLDKIVLYRHLLRDLLPATVFRDLGLESQDVDASFSTVEAEFIRQREDLAKEAGVKRVALRALVRSSGDCEMEIDDATVDALDKNFDILPVIHFIYMTSHCSFDEIQSIIDSNNILKPLREVLSFLEANDLAEIDWANHIARRHLPVFRVPRTRKGTAFKNKFLLEEVKKSIGKPRGTTVSTDVTWVSSSVTCLIPGESTNIVEEKVGELQAALSSHDRSLNDKGTVPYFISVIISPRGEYSVPGSNVLGQDEEGGE